jgi:hypothetical protein
MKHSRLSVRRLAPRVSSIAALRLTLKEDFTLRRALNAKLFHAARVARCAMEQLG